jgi:Leucine-rich repeat (LRR) protein
VEGLAFAGLPTAGMGVLTHALIKYLTGEYDVEVVRRLVASAQGSCFTSGDVCPPGTRAEGCALSGIKRIEALESSCNLLELNLSKNEIGRIEGLEGLGHLARLDLSSNRIAVIGKSDAKHCSRAGPA